MRRIVTILVVLTGCGRGENVARDQPIPASASADVEGLCEVDPDPSAAPCGGEWCAEHGVPEAECEPCKARGEH
jgi:hypothetical protein